MVLCPVWFDQSYLEDYLTANGDDIATPFTDEQKGDIYAELATGAESGWDYTARCVTFSTPLVCF